MSGGGIIRSGRNPFPAHLARDVNSSVAGTSDYDPGTGSQRQFTVSELTRIEQITSIDLEGSGDNIDAGGGGYTGKGFVEVELIIPPNIVQYKAYRSDTGVEISDTGDLSGRLISFVAAGN